MNFGKPLPPKASTVDIENFAFLALLCQIMPNDDLNWVLTKYNVYNLILLP